MFTTPRRLALAAAAGATICSAPFAAPVAADDPTADTTSTLLDACPIEGDHEWIDSWGWRRSGGRSHQGIDVGAPHGTELYAVRDGWANFKQTNLGGNSVWITTDDGDAFFYAHLDGFVGDDREVEAGELIGWVGSTGNAGGPHLHFETHPGGAVENPFVHVVTICSAPPEPAEPTPAALPHETGTAEVPVHRSAIDAFVDELDHHAALAARGVGERSRLGTADAHPA